MSSETQEEKDNNDILANTQDYLVVYKSHNHKVADLIENLKGRLKFG